MQKDFITATPDSGGSGSTTVTATAPANQTESARSVNLSVAGGGMTQAVSLSQAAKITVSPTTVFSSMSSPNTGQSYGTTITVSNCPTKPTVSIVMNKQLDNGLKRQMGDAANTQPVSAGTNKWTFSVYPTNWYHATGGTGISLVPGYYCQGKVTVTLTVGNSATVSIQGNVPTN